MTCWLCGFETTELVTYAEIPSCKNGPCQICVEVANIDKEINQAVATLQRLIAKRYDLRSEQNHYHDPMHRLPLELRNHIFEMVLPKRDQWGEIVGRTASRIIMPSRLASICRNWRDVAWSNPSLWSTIRIKHVTRGPGPSTWIPFVQDWILRSRTSPLTLRINTHNLSKMVWGGILDVISPSSDRWQSLSFSGRRQRLPASHLGTFHYDRLRRLQITAHGELTPVTCFNTTMSPEEIYINGLSFQELQISWNHLTSATIRFFSLENVAQLFQHASRMTYCHLIDFWRAAENFSMPPIIHQSLTALRLSSIHALNLNAAILFGSLTLPYLQEFHTDDMAFLTAGYLPTLVHRSSSPLTSISLDAVPTTFHNLQPWPGITNLVLSTVDSIDGMTRLLLEEEHFPDLRYLTLRSHAFLLLWKLGFIRKLLDRKGPRLDSPNEGRLHKLLVVEEDRAMWGPDIEELSKAFNIRLREDGFEIS